MVTLTLQLVDLVFMELQTEHNNGTKKYLRYANIHVYENIKIIKSYFSEDKYIRQLEILFK